MAAVPRMARAKSVRFGRLDKNMTTWVSSVVWHNWLDEAGYDFDIAAFYYGEGDAVRFPVVTVALWLALQPEVMQSFLARFRHDTEDIQLACSEMSKAYDGTTLAVLHRWIEGASDATSTVTALSPILNIGNP